MKKSLVDTVAKDAAKAGLGKARDAGTAGPVKVPLVSQIIEQGR
jgi:hypothetical protein